MKSEHTILVESMKGTDRLKDLGVNVKVIINKIFKKIDYVCVDWHHMARDSVQQQALVNMMMNLWDT
jgi:hypothetical protein